jgi:hypothetical protein
MQSNGIKNPWNLRQKSDVVLPLRLLRLASVAKPASAGWLVFFEAAI